MERRRGRGPFRRVPGLEEGLGKPVGRRLVREAPAGSRAQLPSWQFPECISLCFRGVSRDGVRLSGVPSAAGRVRLGCRVGAGAVLVPTRVLPGTLPGVCP